MRHFIARKQMTECGLWLGGPEFKGRYPENTATLNWELVTCGACRRAAGKTASLTQGGKTNG